MRQALIVGGTNGIGLAIALTLSQECDEVFIIGRNVHYENLPKNIRFIKKDLSVAFADLSFIPDETDCFIYCAGTGRVISFENLTEKEIDYNFQLNCISFFKLLSRLRTKLFSHNDFYCGVISSIASRISSPLFSIYSATKAAIFRGVESINVELNECGSPNRICDIAPGFLEGTSFRGDETNLFILEPEAKKIIESIKDRKTEYFPRYEEVYRDVLQRYNSDKEHFGKESYRYKIKGNRMELTSKLKIGYLSGSFDLFHIGHLNLLKNARNYCDYLVVGVHRDGSHKGKELFIPFEERMEIVRNIKYVDAVIESEKEDSDVYKKGLLKYDKLFVGSDYKGTERFNRYEEFFKDKGVEIIYFPYTKGTSSTQLREIVCDIKTT